MFLPFLYKLFDLLKYKIYTKQEVYNFAGQDEVHFTTYVPEETERQNAWVGS